MPMVEVMPDTLASQVAAGEVIERPASVIKELVENSVDAGARKIEVEIQRGGVALMRVRDDGCGMSARDAVKSLERHATSKLRTSDDLASIMTLGFRGEALPSIASVARFTMLTCEAGAAEGTEVRVDGGEQQEPRAIGCPMGTSIEVRDLFFNVPARKKFLKAETTEAAHIDHQLRLHALCTPKVGWVLRKDGRVVFDLPATSDRRVRIEAMTGSESGKALIEVPRWEGRGITVEGAVLPAEFARKGKKHQYVFLNGRPVEDAVISRALKESFKGALSEGMQPGAWLWLSIDPSEVDVNVHPAKREVRFSNAAQVRLAIMEAVEIALRPKEIERPVLTPTARFTPPTKHFEAVASVVEDRSPVTTSAQPVWRSERQEELPVEEEEIEQGSSFRVIGSLSARYVLLEGDEGLVLLEPKAAQERIIYERLLAKEEEIDSQGLLVPELLELDSRDADLLMRHQEFFEDAGFSLESFGGQTVQISSVPAFLKLKDSRSFLTGLVDSILDHEVGGRVKRLAYEGFAAKVSKAGAAQMGWSQGEVDGLLKNLFACDLPYCDPAGQPTLVQISFQELERKFGRK
ncbi:DNA mismatch repair endonuclease MutL [Akkermansiaceae bacterium]|nr:DNA mismatch repair endonuclease MutL [Akkermansiaceae bacterium]MDB4813436.1 DNA mismatch repair endonuclease MutL [bacterium]